MARGVRGIEALRPNYDPARDRRPLTAGLGIIALVLCVVSGALDIFGITASLTHDYTLGTNLGFAAIAVTAFAFVVGAAAFVTHRGRGLGLVAMVIALLANPLVLTKLLAWLAGLG
jgi:hypothetical protein